MGLPELAHTIRKELSVDDLKIAAQAYGFTYFYFTQKIKAIDTKKEDLLRAVECFMKVHNERDKKIQDLYQKFLNEIRNETQPQNKRS